MLTEKDLEREMLKVALDHPDIRKEIILAIAGKPSEKMANLEGPPKEAKLAKKERAKLSSEEVAMQKGLLRLAMEVPEHREELLNLYSELFRNPR